MARSKTNRKTVKGRQTDWIKENHVETERQHVFVVCDLGDDDYSTAAIDNGKRSILYIVLK